MYRLLNEGESLNAGDEWFIFETEGNGFWEKVDNFSIGEKKVDDKEPIRRDMDKWPDGIPPIGTKVNIVDPHLPSYDLWVTVDHGQRPFVLCYPVVGQYGMETSIVDIKYVKPWRAK